MKTGAEGRSERKQGQKWGLGMIWLRNDYKMFS